MEDRQENETLPSMFPIEWGNQKREFFVLFSDQAIRKMLQFRQDSLAKPEAGGILVGFRRKPHLEVVDVSTPAFLDKRTRTGFNRRDGKHQRFAKKCWKESNGYIDYLGEWHTHPEHHPTPSSLDIEESLAKAVEVRRTQILEVIIGTDGAWMGLVSASGVKKLLPIPAL